VLIARFDNLGKGACGAAVMNLKTDGGHANRGSFSAASAGS